MSSDAPEAPYIARRIDVNDKSVSIKQSRAIEKKNGRKTNHFRRIFRNGTDFFKHNEA